MDGLLVSTDENEYNDLLKRARSQLPETIFETSRFEVPRVQSRVEGRRTIITNWNQLAEDLRRPERHLLKYFASEMATASTSEGHRAIFNGKHSRHFLNELLKRYVDEYVLCDECGKPDTNFHTSDRIIMIRCEACGAQRAARAVK